MDDLTYRVLSVCRGELIGLYPGLGEAFGWLEAVDGEALGTDGTHLFVPPELKKMYGESPARVRRALLHCLLHCLYLHIRLPEKADPEAWGLACDIWAETFVDQLHQPRLETGERPGPDITGTPWQILERLDSLPKSWEALKASYQVDDHRFWPRRLEPEIEKRWQSLGAGGGVLGRESRGSLTFDGAEEAEKGKALFDFRRFLSRYTRPGEELETDEDSFDYIFYHLGMERYGNLPLLEPLEYKEVWRLDTLAIAIDTSGSCDKDIVSTFLEEIYGIFFRKENFFHKMQVVFFQCDCCLQDVTWIHSPEDWMRYSEHVKILGRGGTDYTPVFREIERLRSEKRLPKPRALLYFTDGDGVYPHRPDYETVFILAGPKKQKELVPKWAYVLELE